MCQATRRTAIRIVTSFGRHTRGRDLGSRGPGVYAPLFRKKIRFDPLFGLISIILCLQRSFCVVQNLHSSTPQPYCRSLLSFMPHTSAHCQCTIGGYSRRHFSREGLSAGLRHELSVY
ncbi:hypothetical protein FKP32DRAFT_95016 [Trametes sanguinea]|nr:hypothetical protein FKP32DRAFT_95016 [Trametes sanguinea]